MPAVSSCKRSHAFQSLSAVADSSGLEYVLRDSRDFDNKPNSSNVVNELVDASHGQREPEIGSIRAMNEHRSEQSRAERTAACLTRT